MIPILPTPSLDPTLEFYEALGFRVTYRQARPNAYAVVERGGIRLDFFVLKALDPTQSYSSCYALVSDVDSIYEAFTTGLRTALGRLPSRGLPRIGALRDMSYGVRQFLMVDPGGNTIRIGQQIKSSGDAPDGTGPEPGGRLERALEAAILLGDSKGDHETAARVVDSALDADPDAAAVVRVRALILRADLAIRAGDEARARACLESIGAIELSDEERGSIEDDLRRARDLSVELAAAD
jgi:catechol 2,3-dioxygenase-like lactoylglutathione lyase family enzyme